MSVLRFTSCWNQQLLQLLGYIGRKQYADLNLRHLTANSIFIYPHMCELRTFSHQKGLPGYNSPNFPHSRTATFKEQKKVTPRTSFPVNKTGVRSKESESLKPQQQRQFLWMKSVHQQLMKSVIFPSKRDSLNFKNSSIKSFSTSDLMSVAQEITFVDKETMKIIVALWRRLDLMNLEEILTTADIFVRGGVSVSWYNSAMITYVDEMLDSLSFTPLQLTRLVFHISNHGSAPPSLSYGIEKILSENISSFDINLLAIIFQLQFTGQNRIKSPILVDKIANKLLEDLYLLEQRHLPMMMKMFRYSNYIKISFYKQLGDRLVTSKYFNQAMHIAFAYASVRVTHPQLFQTILLQCQRDHTNYRLKDIAKIIWACGTLNTNQEENISCIHDILLLKKRSIINQLKEYPDNLIDLLMGLSMLKIYPHDLINKAFDPAILKILFNLPPHREKFFQLNYLDHSLSIECPDYSGFRLTEADRITVAQILSDKSLEMDMHLRKSVKPVVAALDNILDPDCVKCKFVLPHCQTSDIILAFDLEKKLFVKPVEKPLRPAKIIDKQVPHKTTKDLVLLLLSRMQTSFDGQPLGLLQSKIRQLQALGYLVITVDADEAISYACLDMGTTQRLLLGHISTALGVDVCKLLLVS